MRFFSPAFEAKLVPGEKVLRINGREFSPTAMEQALLERKADSATLNVANPISIVVQNGEGEREVPIDYHEGERFPALERDPKTPDFLDRLLEPLTK